MLHFMWKKSSLFVRINIQIWLALFMCGSSRNHHAICESLGIPRWRVVHFC